MWWRRHPERGKVKKTTAVSYGKTIKTALYHDCEGVGDVVGVEAPLGGVAQVIFHRVRVVEVGVRLRVHQDRRVEEDGEGQVDVEREVEEVREKRTKT